MLNAKTQQKLLIAESISGASIGALLGATTVAPIAYLFPSLTDLVMSLGAMVGGSWIGWVMGMHTQNWHLSGMEYIEDTDKARLTLQTDEIGMFTPAQQAKIISGVKIGGVELSRKREVAHILLVGLPGGGKTVIINNLLLQLIERGDKAIIHDPKGDFSRWLPIGQTLMLGPWDDRAAMWDIAKDINNPESARTWAEALMNAGVENVAQNKFFYDNARDLFAALIQYYILVQPDNWGWHDLNSDIGADITDLFKKACQGNPAAAMILPGLKSGKGMSNSENTIVQTFRNGVSFIQNYALSFPVNDPQTEKFSVRDFMRGATSKSLIVLNNNAVYKTAAESIFAGILSIASQMAASAEMPELSADKGGIWFILDEYPQLGASAAISVQTIEEMGRSRGVRVIKALQDYSQVYQRAGRDHGQAQLNLQQTRIFCKIAPETASIICQSLGKRSVVNVQNKTLTGQNTKTLQHEDRDVLRPADLLDLKAPTSDKQGIEFIMLKDGKLGKLVQKFPAGNKIKPHSVGYIERRAWAHGLTDYVNALNNRMSS